MATRMSKYVAELIGTFTLVFVGTGVATVLGYYASTEGGARLVPGQVWLAVALAFGGTLLVLAYTLGKVSGCHVNPAVTVAAALGKKMDSADVLPYIVMQFIGGILASAVVLVMMGGMPDYAVSTHGLAQNVDGIKGMSLTPIIVSEVVLTMLFLLVILASTDPRNLPAGFAPIPIGGFLFVAHLLGAPLGYSSLNPARSLGPALLVGGDALNRLGLMLTAPFVGAILGLILYMMIWPSDAPPRRAAAPSGARSKVVPPPAAVDTEE